MKSKGKFGDVQGEYGDHGHLDRNMLFLQEKKIWFQTLVEKIKPEMINLFLRI